MTLNCFFFFSQCIERDNALETEIRYLGAMGISEQINQRRKFPPMLSQTLNLCLGVVDNRRLN